MSQLANNQPVIASGVGKKLDEKTLYVYKEIVIGRCTRDDGLFNII